MVCPDPYCKKNNIVDVDIRAVLNDIRFRQFERKRNEWRVDTDANKAWCLHCSRGVVDLNSRSFLTKSVKCSDEHCNEKSCSKCGLIAHPFVTCKRARSRHFNMFVANNNCKRCPGCKIMIEKSGGCNHMTCRQCNHNFCWLCRTRWRGGCKNKLCKPNNFLNERLGCAAPYAKVPIVVIGAPGEAARSEGREERMCDERRGWEFG
jgi:hypothetical protein